MFVLAAKAINKLRQITYKKYLDSPIDKQNGTVENKYELTKRIFFQFLRPIRMNVKFLTRVSTLKQAD